MVNNVKIDETKKPNPKPHNCVSGVQGIAT